MTLYWMSQTTARSLLTGRLVFGDEMQIAALQYLRDLATAKQRIGECECDACQWCYSTGTELTDPVHELCHMCSGTGTCDRCSCFDGLNAYAVRDARESFIKRLRRLS